MSLMDDAILASFPLQPVGPSGAVPQAAGAGIRYLAAANGLWREISLPWVTVRHCVAPTYMPLPYGPLTAAVDVRCSVVPVELVREFTRAAKEASPVEISAAFLWNEADDSWRLAWRQARSSSASHIEYEEVQRSEGEHLVIDAHSHGRWAAAFSGQDDRDDHGSMKFALVVGNLDSAAPTSSLRLCMAGMNIPAQLEQGGRLVAMLKRGAA